MTRGEFAREVLKGIDAPRSKRNMRSLISWMQAEGYGGENNPLNTTQEWAGATTFNSSGVKNYPSLTVGISATIKTLNYSFYDEIVALLHEDAPSWKVLVAVEKSPWGTGGLARKVLAYARTSFRVYADKPVND